MILLPSMGFITAQTIHTVNLGVYMKFIFPFLLSLVLASCFVTDPPPKVLNVTAPSTPVITSQSQFSVNILAFTGFNSSKATLQLLEAGVVKSETSTLVAKADGKSFDGVLTLALTNANNGNKVYKVRLLWTDAQNVQRPVDSEDIAIAIQIP
jgi:hypothetical protein